jgi:hypothetical protein
LARAEPDPAGGVKIAQSLFDRARALMDEGRFLEACPLLAESQRLDPGGGTRLNLAVCLQRAGKLASAHATFNEALSQAIKEGRDERKRIAEEGIAALSGRLSTITVDVPAEARVPGIVVWLDGAKLSQVAWGVPTAVDGGDHHIEATAPEHAPWSTIQRVAPERDAVRVEVRPPAPLFAPIAPSPATPPCAPVHDGGSADSAGSAPKPPGTTRVAAGCIASPPPRATAKRLSTASWAVGGAGVALAAGAVATGVAALILNAQAKSSALADGCNLTRDFCPAGHGGDAIAIASRSHALGWVSTSTAAGSGVLLLTAILLPRNRVPVSVAGGATRTLGWISAGASF